MVATSCGSFLPDKRSLLIFAQLRKSANIQRCDWAPAEIVFVQSGRMSEESKRKKAIANTQYWESVVKVVGSDPGAQRPTPTRLTCLTPLTFEEAEIPRWEVNHKNLLWAPFGLVLLTSTRNNRNNNILAFRPVC
jgi:hypothetical protein